MLVVKDPKYQNVVSERAIEHLGNTFNAVPQLMMNRYLKNTENELTKKNILQCKAYEYGRYAFRKW